MPRKLFKVSNFHGGLDEVSSEVDLKEGYFPSLTDVMVNRLGQIVPMGDFATTATNNFADTGGVAFDIDSSPGYGLYAFTSAISLNKVLTNCTIYAFQQYQSGEFGSNFIFADSNDRYFHRLTDANGDISAGSILDLEDGTVGHQFLPDYFTFNEILRICDGNMENITNLTATNFDFDTFRGWLGFIRHTNFPNSGTNTITYLNDWYGYKTVAPAAPTAGIVSSTASGVTVSTDATGGSTTYIDAANIGTNLENDLTAAKDYLLYHEDITVADASLIEYTSDTRLTVQSSGTWPAPEATDDFRLYPPVGAGVVLALTASNTGGFLPEANYNFGSTFIYDGHQESPIYEMTTGYGTGDGVYAIAAGDLGSFTGYAHLYIGDTDYHPRVTGMRVYYQYDQDLDNRWYLAWDIDFYKGSRTTLSDSVYTEDVAGTPFTRDVLGHAVTGKGVHHTLPSLTLIGESYDAINGYSPNESIDVRYSTSAVVNNLVFIGNVYREVGGVADHYPDRIWRCAKPRYSPGPAVDIFPETYWLDDPGISEPIIKLESLGNQLLSFSTNHLTVWTIAAEGEILSGVFRGYGVNKPCQVTKGSDGIVFMNRSGVYKYNSDGIQKLLNKRGNA